MKLRRKGDPIRVRLDRRDLETPVDSGRVADAVHFGPGVAFSYAVESPKIGPLGADPIPEREAAESCPGLSRRTIDARRE